MAPRSAAQQARLRRLGRRRAALAATRSRARCRRASWTSRPSRRPIKPGESTTLTWAVENPRDDDDRADGRHGPTPRGVAEGHAEGDDHLHADGDRRERHADAGRVTVNVAGTHAGRRDGGSCRSTEQPAPRTADGKPDLSGRLRLRRRARPRRAAAAGRTRLAAAHADAEAGRREVPRRPRPDRHRPLLDVHAAGRPADVHGSVLHAVRPVAEARGRSCTSICTCRARSRWTARRIRPTPIRSTWATRSASGKATRWSSIRSASRRARSAAIKTTEALHVVERFRRPNLGTLEYEAVIEDPNVFAGPG